MKNEKAKFTEGSWRINIESNGDLWIDVEHKTDIIANVCCGWNPLSKKYEPTEEELSNANLIVSAPKMYEACILAKLELESAYKRLGFTNSNILTALNEAIESAEG